VKTHVIEVNTHVIDVKTWKTGGENIRD
jgi:hypothetical protein